MSTQFTAFISYSHRDSRWAKWVQRAIENYRLPKALASEMGRSRKLGKVFRDREELSTGQNLGDHLTAALDSSDNLIVICSPNSKASPWVAKEIEYFKALGRGDRIFCLLVEGGAESLADPLLTDIDGNPLEPLAADPRDGGDGKRLAKLKLISGILNTNLDQLAQRERARRQRLFLGYAGLANIFLIAVGAALYFEQERQNEAAQKALERELGIQNVASMTEFVERTRQYYDKGALSFVSERFTGYLDRFDDSELDANQKVTKAKALRVVGEANYDLGDTSKSIAALESSVELLELASAEEPTNLDLAIETAFADFYLGATHVYAKNYEAALPPLERYRDRILALYKQYPDNPLLIEESINAPTSILRLHADANSVVTPDMRVAVLEVSDAVNNIIAGDSELAASLFHSLDSAMHYSASAHMKSCEVFNALPYRTRAVEYARKAVELDPRNRDYKTNLANALFAYAQMQLFSDKPEDAISNYFEALKIQTQLQSADPSNDYLAKRISDTKTELLVTLMTNPELSEEIKNNIFNAIGSGWDTGNARASITKEMYLLLSIPEKVEALEHVRNLRKVSDQTSVSLLQKKMASAIVQLHGITIDKELTLNLPLPETAVEGQDCSSRFFRWADSVNLEDEVNSERLLQEMNTLGYLGLAVGYFSKRLPRD